MKHRIFCTLALCAALLLTACGGKGLKVDLDALGSNGSLLLGVPPCCTVDEAMAAGVPLEDAPSETQISKDGILESTVYRIEDEAFILDLAGVKCESGFFQFINGKFTNLTVDLPNEEDCDAVVARMTQLYGEPVVEEQMEGKIIQNLWTFTEGEYPVRAAVLGRAENGKVVLGTFQVSYDFFIHALGTS